MRSTGCGNTYEERRRRSQEEMLRKQLLTQKLLGIILLLISVAIFVVAASGTTLETKDGTPLVITVPLGIYLLLTHETVNC